MLTKAYGQCEEPVIRMLIDMLEQELEYIANDGDDYFDATQNARVVADGERYIGVIYRPETERWSHYSQSTLAREYDAFVWFDTTGAITPLPDQGPVQAGVDDTYPFGL